MSWSQLTVQYVFASQIGPAISLENMNLLFRWDSFWYCWVCKQVELSHLGQREPARLHWKVDTPKTNHCLVPIFVQRHIWAFFSLKMNMEWPLQSWRSLSGHVEWIFVHKNCRGRYWQHFVSRGRGYVLHSRSYTRFFAPCFWRSHYQPQSWFRLATHELRFGIVGQLFVGCR